MTVEFFLFFSTSISPLAQYAVVATLFRALCRILCVFIGIKSAEEIGVRRELHTRCTCGYAEGWHTPHVDHFKGRHGFGKSKL